MFCDDGLAVDELHGGKSRRSKVQLHEVLAPIMTLQVRKVFGESWEETSAQPWKKMGFCGVSANAFDAS